jgi:hypothetical protein
VSRERRGLLASGCWLQENAAVRKKLATGKYNHAYMIYLVFV